MALSLKPGVLFEDIHSRIIETLPTIDRIYLSFGFNGVITSARDGKHMANSLHYQGKALDWRTNFFTPLQRLEFHWEVQNALGSDFDVVLEKDHLHQEFDPHETPIRARHFAPVLLRQRSPISPAAAAHQPHRHRVDEQGWLRARLSGGGGCLDRGARSLLLGDD